MTGLKVGKTSKRPKKAQPKLPVLAGQQEARDCLATLVDELEFTPAKFLANLQAIVDRTLITTEIV